MKLFLLGAAALIAAPVMAQSQTAGAPAGATQTMPGPVPPVATSGGAMNSSQDSMGQTAPADQSMQTPPPPPADGSMQAPGQPPMGQPPMGQAPMSQPGMPMNGQAMGTSPTGAPIVMGPMNTTPPPAATANPPVCKRGQTDDCREPGSSRRARRR